MLSTQETDLLGSVGESHSNPRLSQPKTIIPQLDMKSDDQAKDKRRKNLEKGEVRKTYSGQGSVRIKTKQTKNIDLKIYTED